MSIINTFFGNNQAHNNLFPKPTANGEVSIENNILICQDYSERSIYNSLVNLDDLQYAYINLKGDGDNYLFLFDHHQNDIPVTFKGFKEVYTQLSQRFHFNNDVFFHNVHKSERYKKRIWIRKYPKNYTVLTENYTDYNAGYEIQSEPKVFLSWETTYADIQQNPHVYFETSPYNQKLLKFKYPVRIGNIILNTLHAYFDNPRTDVPVLHFYSHCYSALGTDDSYYDLKRVLLQDVFKDQTFNGYERDDQKNLIFNLNNISLSICYTYDSKWQFDAGNTSITIKNNREYPKLLMDEAYEKDIVISNVLTLQGDFNCPKDYMRNARITYRPNAITAAFQATTIIWTDTANNKIGCSAKGYAQTFDIAEIDSFSIRNILPARGRGGSELYIITTDKTYHSVLRGVCKAFDNYVENIEQLTGKKVTFEKEYYDC
ncbi:hypothetical protein [uncultured Formosa sp.]|uniref:hypothetical protein n=1 Tax=uncultured Formosa sp. TaxID=255435 RepID=UPI002613A9A8|nr:hypothetical protein [uncultured Formosa sp.]